MPASRYGCEAGDGRSAGQVDLQIPAVSLEFRCGKADPDLRERGAAEDGHPTAPAQMRFRRGEVPAVCQRRGGASGELRVVSAGLLQADHIGGARRQPGQQTAVLC